MNVYEWDAVPGVDRRLYPLAANRAMKWVVSGGVKLVTLPNGRRAVQKLPPIEVKFKQVAFSEKNLIPFARTRDPLIAPDKLHYEIPHAGDRSLYARHHRRLLSVSARNQIWPASGPQFRFQNLANVIG